MSSSKNNIEIANNSKNNNLLSTGDKSVFLVIPAYNEENALGNLLENLVRFDYKIVVVDDGSKDETYLIAKSIKEKFQNNIFLCKHLINRGVGAATKTGMEDALIHGAKYIITFDADGQHAIEDIEKVTKALIENRADVVIGSRPFKDMPFSKRVANMIMNFITLLFYKVAVKDSQSGLRGYDALVIPKLNIHSDGYGALSEFTREIKKNNLKLEEVEITTIYTPETQAKGTNAIVGFKIFVKMVRDIFR
ncbi:glycosyltransferase family 2 protein [Methanobrevibacter filiformis]|uniref:Undecaprenyl-phosphate mannosyltransferase n=1 Tax=Methanobrevibacter filiformis TaxID=55758 RepID=A0A166DM12_9EURY|nr:glycosyltransferase family 2 protein [Methanobrevibacter filiformis]KZX15741.1 undecaprenyl-phosphate mannosyltransferase [Methanobrevibacter filiformis]